MICSDCNTGSHRRCPELMRQNDSTLNDVERAGGQRCDCQHQRNPRRAVKGSGPIVIHTSPEPARVIVVVVPDSRVRA